jgi:hypothetical protein
MLLLRNSSGMMKLLPSMKKMRMHMTTSTMGVMLGPTMAIFLMPFFLPPAFMIAPEEFGNWVIW